MPNCFFLLTAVMHCYANCSSVGNNHCVCEGSHLFSGQFNVSNFLDSSVVFGSLSVLLGAPESSDLSNLLGSQTEMVTVIICVVGEGSHLFSSQFNVCGFCDFSLVFGSSSVLLGAPGSSDSSTLSGSQAETMVGVYHFGTRHLAYFWQHIQDICSTIEFFWDQCHIHMYHSAVAWILNVTYVCAIRLRALIRVLLVLRDLVHESFPRYDDVFLGL